MPLVGMWRRGPKWPDVPLLEIGLVANTQASMDLGLWLAAGLLMIASTCIGRDGHAGFLGRIVATLCRFPATELQVVAWAHLPTIKVACCLAFSGG